MTSVSNLHSLRLQLMWGRLISVVEEQALALVRTGFSAATREAGDLSAGIFDLTGNMLAQAVTGTPGHVNAMARSVGHFLKKFPDMADGDVFLTNDPWLGTGHLHDFTFVTPAFVDGTMVGLFASTCHVVDIGGRGLTADAKQVFEEGVLVPLMRFAVAGEVNSTLMDIIESNVREPIQVIGDFYSLAACNEIGCKRLRDMMREFGIQSLDELGRYITSSSRRAMLDEIRRIPAGSYTSSMLVDGYEKPIKLVATTTVDGEGISIDFTGTSESSGQGINVPLCYTEAYASFAVKCIVAPDLPNNEGTLALVRVSAPDDCILNARRPAPVAARHITGQMVPNVVFGCLDQALPNRVPAEGTSCLWNLSLRGGKGRVETGTMVSDDAIAFEILSFHSGGTGGRPANDGLSATAFPSGVRTVPAEVTELMAPVVIWRKELREDSGGPGEFRGGLGQVMEVGTLDTNAFAISAFFDRIENPPRGRSGGLAGMPGQIRLASGHKLRGKGVQTVAPTDHVVLGMPGGGGLGDPHLCPAASVQQDVRMGLVSRDSALKHYGVALDALGEIDEKQTLELRCKTTTS